MVKKTLFWISCSFVALPLICKRLDLMSALIFSGSLSNSVGIYDISGEAFKQREYTDENRKSIRRAKCLLITQLFLLSAIIGLASWQIIKTFSGRADYIRLGFSFILVLSALVIAAIQKFKDISLGIVISIFLYIVSLYVFPDVLRLFSKLILDIFDKLLSPNCLNFVKERFFSYLNLLVIPLLFLIPDKLNKDIIPDARKAIPIDWGLSVAGGLCLIAGFVAENPIFEAGCSAAILINGNYLYTYMLKRMI